MHTLIACCGLDCSQCDARIATLTGDEVLRNETARRWSAMNQAPEITPETICCTGCRTEGAKFAYCALCAIRQCAVRRGHATCGACPEMETYPTVEAVFRHAPEARERLRRLRDAGQ